MTKKQTLYISILFVSGLISAQVVAPGQIVEGEVVVEKSKKITPPSFSRVYKPVKIEKLTIDKKQYDFAIPLPSQKPALAETPLVAQDLEKGREISVKPKLDILFGMGNFIAPLVQISTINQQKSDRIIGAVFYHDAYYQGITGDNRSAEGTTQMNANYRDEKWLISGGVARHFSNYYAIPNRTAFDSLGGGPLVFHQFLSEIQYDILNEDSYTWNTTFSLRHDQLTKSEGVFNKNTDTGIDWISDFSKQIKWGRFMAPAYFQWSRLNSVNSSFRFWSYINPKIQIDKEDLSVQAGFSFGWIADQGSSKPFITPDLAFQYRLNRQLQIFTKVSGGIERNILQDMYNVNPYLSDSLIYQTTTRQVELNVGSRVYLSKQFFISPSISIEQKRDAQFFQNSGIFDESFVSIYDDLIVKSASFSGNWVQNSNTANIKFDVFQYTTDTLKVALHMPGWQIKWQSEHKIYKKIHIQTNYVLLGNIKAISSQSDKINGLDPIIDLAIKTKYHINNQQFIFLHLNNLLNQENTRFLNYPNRTISFRLGYSIRFD